MIDTHAHLTDKRYANMVDEVLQRSRQAGVDGWITVGTDLADSEACVQLAQLYEDMHCTVGVHPHEADKQEKGFLDELGKLATAEPVVAIGEIGLDYHYEFSQRDRQKRIFEEQLSLATELKLPVVVHCREAFDDCLGILNDWANENVPLVFHCFSGDKAMAKTVLDRGYYVSFTGTITFKKAEPVQAAAAYVPLNRVLLETDCPYLSPAPKRNVQPNEPGLMVLIAEKLGQLREVKTEEIAQATEKNSRLFFKIEKKSDKI